MTIDWWTLALQAVNFLVLVWLLQRFLYKPVMAVIARRREEAQRALDEAARREAEADRARRGFEQEQAGVSAMREKVMAEARDEIEAERKKTIEQARQEAAEVMKTVRAKLADERDEALEQLRGRAIDLGADIAAQLLKETASEAMSDVFLARVCDHLANLPENERAELRKALGDGGRVTVVTAPALDEAQQKRWRERLEAVLGGGAAIDFDADDSLIAGAELHFRDAILRFTWRESVEQARRELKSRAEAE